VTGLRVLRGADHRPVPWKNGLGLTYEVARSSEGDDFDWRVSFAAVERPGPFSSFPGIDRIITPAAGSRLALTMPAGDVQVLRPFEPFAFPGEAEVRGEPSGATMNLNVMTRRGRATATVVCRRIVDRQTLDLSGTTFLVVFAGALLVQDIIIAPRDVVRELPDRLTVTGNGVVALVAIDVSPAGPADSEE
jgi:uncharacterized protein